MQQVTPSSMFALAVAFLNICTILVVLRLVGRRVQKLPIGTDDIMMLVSWVFTMAMCINMITAVAYKLWGRKLPPRMLPNGRISAQYGYSALIAQSEEFAFIQELLFPLQLMFAKLSILFLYRRIFCVGRRDFMHWSTLILIVSVSLWGVILFFMYLFQCGTHFSLVWDGPLALELTNCLPASLELGMGASDTLFDLVIMLLPLRRILTLHTRATKKLLILAVFVVGSITIAASVVRLAIYTSLMVGVRNSFTMMDENMTVSTEMFWGMFEAGFAVTTACIPSINGLLSKMAKGVGEKWGIYGYGSRSRRQTSKDSKPPSNPEACADVERNASDASGMSGLEKKSHFSKS